jgi:hypothetical protein
MQPSQKVDPENRANHPPKDTPRENEASQPPQTVEIKCVDADYFDDGETE